MTDRGACVVLRRARLTDGQVAAFRVNGWEIERGVGGANQIVGRERVLDGRIGHASCVREAVRLGRRGIAPTQGTLL